MQILQTGEEVAAYDLAEIGQHCNASVFCAKAMIRCVVI